MAWVLVMFPNEPEDAMNAVETLVAVVIWPVLLVAVVCFVRMGDWDDGGE